MGEFEKDLRNAFEGADFAPSDRVWEGVQQGLRPRKKGIFFMWQTYGVAATLIFLLTMGFLLRSGSSTEPVDGPEERLTQTEQPKETEKGSTEKASDAPAKADNPPSTDAAVEAGSVETKAQETLVDIKDLQASNDKGESSGMNTAGTATDQALVDLAALREQSTNGLVPLVAGTEVDTEESGENLLIDQNAIALLTLSDLQESIAAIRNRWELKNMVGPMEFNTGDLNDLPAETDTRRASLNGALSGGNFNPNGSGDEMALSQEAQNLSFNDPRFDAARSIVSTNETQLGSVSVGFGVGLPLGKRWLFKTGLRYSQYRFASTTNAYSMENGMQLPIYSRVGFDTTEVFYAGEYQLTHTLHSISIPAQIGFRVLNFKRFSTWLNVGVAADYTANYTIKGDLNFLDTRKVDFGQTDFINRFNVNVLTGFELAYQLNDKFALSGEVFLRQYVRLEGATDGTFQASPSFFGFGLGVNYYLKKKD